MKNLLIVLLAYWISTNIYSQPGHYIFHEATNIKNQGYGFLHEAQNTKNLVNGIIYEMIQDELGFLWMATNGGLYRYDGSGVLNIRQEPFNSNSLSDNSLADLVQDQMGNIWLATFNGLNMYNPQTGKIRHYFPGDSTAINQSIYQLVRDSLNRLWIAVNSSELYTLDLDRYYGDESLRDKPEFNKTGFSDIMSLFVDAKNNVMLIQKRKLFILADGLAPVKDNFRRILFDAGLDHYPSCGSNHMYQDMYGNYWIGGFRSVFWVPNRELDMNTDSDTIIARVRLHRFDDVWPEQKSYYIEDIVTRQNELWLGLLYKGGLSTAKFDSAGELSDPYTFPHLDRNTPGDKFPDYIADLFVDNSDNLWATNHEGGKYILYNWTPGFRSYHPTDTEIKLPTYQALINLFEDRSGIIWLCTNTDGLIHFNKETEEFGGGELIAGWSIYTGLEDRFNNFWVGGWLFLRVFNKDGNNLEAAPEDVVDIELPEGEGYKKNVSSLYEDESGLWVGADNCMYHISNLGSIKENMGEDLVIRAFPFDSTKYALNLVTAIETNDHFDSLNLLFLSTYRGIQVFNRKTETFAHMQYDPEIQNGLNVNGIFDLCIDGQNNIWIATSDGGLNKLIFMDTAPDDQSAFVPSISFPDGRTMYYTVTHLTKENGFPDDILSGLVLDRDDNLWINSGIGLIRYSLPEGGISYFSTINGNPFSPSEGLIMHSDGELCAIGNQLVLLDLNKLENQENKNPVLFTDLRIQQESVLPGESSFLKKSMPFSDYLEIPFRRKMDLIIEFALVNVRDPELHSYKYRLKGSDDEWIQIPSGAREAHFTNLQPGKYTLEVLAQDNHGVWTEEPAAISMNILPPWYRSIPAWIVYVLFFGSAPFAFIWFRTRQLTAEKIRLEEKVAERTRVIEKQKEEVVTINDALEKQKEELEATLENLRRTQDQLIESEKLAALGGLVAGVAHEINTPVGISVTAASSLVEETRVMAEKYKENKISRNEFKDYLNTANQSAQLILSNMQRTAEMVQSFKQVSVDQSSEQKRRFKLREYCEDIIRSLYPSLKDRKVLVKLEISNDLEMDSFPGAISQIITNLVVNSLNHGFGKEEEGNISLSGDRANGDLILEYSDNGRGMEPEVLNRIFEPFFSTNKNVGTGLGLHIVYNLVTQKLGGSITCESTPGKGASFHIKIPMRER